MKINNSYAVNRHQLTNIQLEDMYSVVKEGLQANREEDKKYNLKRKYILVTGDSWAQGEIDSTKPEDWSENHSLSYYLSNLFPYAYVGVSIPNPGWDDLESVCMVQILYELFDYIVFFKTCGLRTVQFSTNPGRKDYGITEEAFREADIYNIILQGRAINDIVYDFLQPYASKLILIGGLNKIAGKGLDLKTVLTIPSVLERYDSKVADVDVFGWENMWDFYKDKVKGNQEYQESLLTIMDIFAKKKKYMESKPDLYFPDGKHPNDKIHKNLAEYLGDYLWKQ